MSENKYPIGGYAPGNYHNRCITCERSFFGNKRAVQCEPCAVADKEKFDALSPAEQNELLKRNAEIMNEFIKNDSSNEQLSGDDQVCGKTELNNLATISNASLPGDDAVQNWFEENINKECSASSAIYKFRLWLESLQHKPTGAVSPILADIIRFKAGASEYFMQHNYRELYAIIQAIIQLAEDGIKISGPVWYTEKEMYNYLRQNNYSTYIANELAKDWAISFQGAYEKGRQHASQQPAGSATSNNEQITAALQKFVSMHETGLLPNRFTYEEGKRALEGIEDAPAPKRKTWAERLEEEKSKQKAFVVGPCTNKNCQWCHGTGKIRIESPTTGLISYADHYDDGSISATSSKEGEEEVKP